MNASHTGMEPYSPAWPRFKSTHPTNSIPVHPLPNSFPGDRLRQEVLLQHLGEVFLAQLEGLLPGAGRGAGHVDAVVVGGGDLLGL